jgi:hypothetical protein
VFPRILRSVIAAREEASVADPHCYIRTPDHVSVLVIAFLRRGKPGSALKPSSKARPPRASLLVRRQNSKLSDRRCVAHQMKPIGSVVRRNSVKGVIHTIRGVRGKDPRDPAVTLRRCGRQVWAGQLPSSIARERQRSPHSRHSIASAKQPSPPETEVPSPRLAALGGPSLARRPENRRSAQGLIARGGYGDRQPLSKKRGVETQAER